MRAKRRQVSVDDHWKFRETIAIQPEFDEIDEALADPILEHLPQRTSAHKANRVLSVLDQIDIEDSSRMDSDRSACIKLIERTYGRGTLQAFLRTAQPDLRGQTGAELLQGSPGELLDHLKRLQQQQTAKSADDSQLQRLLAKVDEIEEEQLRESSR